MTFRTYEVIGRSITPRRSAALPGPGNFAGSGMAEKRFTVRAVQPPEHRPVWHRQSCEGWQQTARPAGGPARRKPLGLTMCDTDRGPRWGLPGMTWEHRGRRSGLV